MTTNAFPELISRAVQAEARNGRNLSLLTHAVGLNTRWLVTQKWYLDAPPPQEQSAAEGGGSIHSSRFLEEKRLHKTQGIWDTFQSTRVTKETINSIMIFFCIFELSKDNCISMLRFAYCPHRTEFESAVLLSPKATNKARGKTLLPLYFSFPFFNPCQILIPVLLHTENQHLKGDCCNIRNTQINSSILKITKAENKKVHRVCKNNRNLLEDGDDI